VRMIVCIDCVFSTMLRERAWDAIGCRATARGFRLAQRRTTTTHTSMARGHQRGPPPPAKPLHSTPPIPLPPRDLEHRRDFRAARWLTTEYKITTIPPSGFYLPNHRCALVASALCMLPCGVGVVGGVGIATC
jgi:aspartate/methionine/tyrosine aminotransferase